MINIHDANRGFEESITKNHLRFLQNRLIRLFLRMQTQAPKQDLGGPRKIP